MAQPCIHAGGGGNLNLELYFDFSFDELHKNIRNMSANTVGVGAVSVAYSTPQNIL